MNLWMSSYKYKFHFGTYVRSLSTTYSWNFFFVHVSSFRLWQNVLTFPSIADLFKTFYTYCLIFRLSSTCSCVMHTQDEQWYFFSKKNTSLGLFSYFSILLYFKIKIYLFGSTTIKLDNFFTVLDQGIWRNFFIE